MKGQKQKAALIERLFGNINVIPMLYRQNLHIHASDTLFEPYARLWYIPLS